MRQNGQNIAAGDRAAINALGAFDPRLAVDINGAIQGQDATRQGMEHAAGRFGMDQERQGWAGEQHRAQLGEYELTEVARGLQQGLVLAASDPAAYDAWAQENGIDVPADQFPAYAARFDADVGAYYQDFLPEPVEREHLNDPLGVPRWTDTGEAVFPGVAPPVSDRQHLEDPNGVPRWLDSGEPVFPGIEPEVDPSEAVGPNGLDPKQQMDAENAFVDDWTSLPAVKDYEGISRAYSNITAAAQEQSGAGDIALITMLGKLLDPTSVVRETEFAIAANAGGTLEWLQSLQGRVENGQLLTENTRAQIVGIATEIQREAEHRFGSVRGQWEGIAEHRGLDPEFVMPGARYSPSYTGAPPFAPVAQPQARPGGLNLPPPIGQTARGSGTVGQADTGQPTGSGASQQPAQGQPAPIAIPSPQDAARMAPSDIAALVREAAAQGITIPGPVRRIMLQRLNQTQGGR